MSQNVNYGQIWMILRIFMDSYSVNCKGKTLLAKVTDKHSSDQSVYMYTEVDLRIVQNRFGQSNVLIDRTLFNIVSSHDIFRLLTI